MLKLDFPEGERKLIPMDKLIKASLYLYLSNFYLTKEYFANIYFSYFYLTKVDFVMPL